MNRTRKRIEIVIKTASRSYTWRPRRAGDEVVFHGAEDVTVTYRVVSGRTPSMPEKIVAKPRPVD
jgi:hypothetical protein